MSSRYIFSSNPNIHKSSCGLCFWAPDPLIDRFYLNLSIKGSGAQKQRAKNFYEHWDLTKKYIYYDVDRLRCSTSKDAGRNLCEKRKKNEWSRQPNASQVSNRIKMGWYPAAPAVNIGICMYVTFWSNHNLNKRLCSFFCGWGPLINVFFWQKNLLHKAYITKTKSTRYFINIVIWRKNISNLCMWAALLDCQIVLLTQQMPEEFKGLDWNFFLSRVKNIFVLCIVIYLISIYLFYSSLYILQSHSIYDSINVFFYP